MREFAERLSRVFWQMNDELVQTLPNDCLELLITPSHKIAVDENLAPLFYAPVLDPLVNIIGDLYRAAPDETGDGS